MTWLQVSGGEKIRKKITVKSGPSFPYITHSTAEGKLRTKASEQRFSVLFPIENKPEHHYKAKLPRETAAAPASLLLRTHLHAELGYHPGASTPSIRNSPPRLHVPPRHHPKPHKRDTMGCKKMQPQEETEASAGSPG